MNLLFGAVGCPGIPFFLFVSTPEMLVLVVPVMSSIQVQAAADGGNGAGADDTADKNGALERWNSALQALTQQCGHSSNLSQHWHNFDMQWRFS